MYYVCAVQGCKVWLSLRVTVQVAHFTKLIRYVACFLDSAQNYETKVIQHLYWADNIVFYVTGVLVIIEAEYLYVINGKYWLYFMIVVT